MLADGAAKMTGLRQPHFMKIECKLNSRFGQVGHGCHYFGKIGETADVPRDQSQHDLLSHIAQHAVQCRLIGDVTGF